MLIKVWKSITIWLIHALFDIQWENLVFFISESGEGIRQIKSRAEFLEGGRIKDGTAGGGWKTATGFVDQITEWSTASDFSGMKKSPGSCILCM